MYRPQACPGVLDPMAFGSLLPLPGHKATTPRRTTQHLLTNNAHTTLGSSSTTLQLSCNSRPKADSELSQFSFWTADPPLRLPDAAPCRAATGTRYVLHHLISTKNTSSPNNKAAYKGSWRSISKPGPDHWRSVDRWKASDAVDKEACEISWTAVVYNANAWERPLNVARHGG